MWLKNSFALLAALCLLVVVGMSGVTYAGDSPYSDDPYDEHPWGGDNLGGDPGTGLPGSPSGTDGLPSSLGLPYYIQTIPVSYIWDYITGITVKSAPASTTIGEIDYLNRTTDKTSSTSIANQGARSK